MNIFSIKERPTLLNKAAWWFHEKWGIPQEAYADSMEASFQSETYPRWYVALEGEEIIGGLGVIDNDFHDRKDLFPNVCALYVEESFRRQGIAGQLLNRVVTDLHQVGINTLYLLTDHHSFYERYGWSFYCLAQGVGENFPSRLYVHYFID